MVLGRLQTQHRDTCLAATRSPFSTFDTQPLSFHILMNSASVNPFGAHTSKKSHIYIKTRGFKPFRDTYLQSVISQTILNHILTKNRGWGEGPLSGSEPKSRVADHGPQKTRAARHYGTFLPPRESGNVMTPFDRIIWIVSRQRRHWCPARRRHPWRNRTQYSRQQAGFRNGNSHL